MVNYILISRTNALGYGINQILDFIRINNWSHTGNYTGNCGFAYAGWAIENHILYCAVFYGTAEYSILAEKMLLTTYVIQFFRSQGCC